MYREEVKSRRKKFVGKQMFLQTGRNTVGTAVFVEKIESIVMYCVWSGYVTIGDWSVQLIVFERKIPRKNVWNMPSYRDCSGNRTYLIRSGVEDYSGQLWNRNFTRMITEKNSKGKKRSRSRREDVARKNSESLIKDRIEDRENLKIGVRWGTALVFDNP